jgi:hypothetical protein
VLSTAAVLLVRGDTLLDALVGAAGLALIGNEVARRLIVDESPLPTVVVGSAVAAFGAVLILTGSSLSEASLGAGLAGVIAGQVAARLFGSTPPPRRGV